MLNLYSKRLEKERFDDVIAALETIQDLPRGEGELAFPEIGAILAMVNVCAVSRQNRARRAEMPHVKQADDKAFWEWADGWMKDTGNTEEELLNRHPSRRGTKPTPQGDDREG